VSLIGETKCQFRGVAAFSSPTRLVLVLSRDADRDPFKVFEDRWLGLPPVDLGRCGAQPDGFAVRLRVELGPYAVTGDHQPADSVESCGVRGRAAIWRLVALTHCQRTAFHPG